MNDSQNEITILYSLNRFINDKMKLNWKVIILTNNLCKFKSSIAHLQFPNFNIEQNPSHAMR